MWFSRSMLFLGAILLLFAAGAAGCGSGGTGSADSFLSEAGLPADAAVSVDERGDVRDVDGDKPPEDVQAGDIIRAGLHLSDSELRLAVEQITPIPLGFTESDYAAGVGEWLVYTLFIADTQGTIIYMPQIGLDGPQWSAYVYDNATFETVELDGEPQIAGSIISYTFPRALLPDLETPFKWAVGTEWTRSSGHEISDRLTFGDRSTHDDTDGWSGYPYQWSDYPQQ